MQHCPWYFSNNVKLGTIVVEYDTVPDLFWVIIQCCRQGLWRGLCLLLYVIIVILYGLEALFEIMTEWWMDHSY